MGNQCCRNNSAIKPQNNNGKSPIKRIEHRKNYEFEPSIFPPPPSNDEKNAKNAKKRKQKNPAIRKRKSEADLDMYNQPFTSVKKPKLQNPIPSHSRNISCHYTVVFPDHEERKSSTTYTHSRNEMIDELKLTCFICGCSKGNDDTSLEAHHFYIEHAGQNAIDWDKFGKFAKTCYNVQTGDYLGDKFNWDDVKKNPDLFVDSKYNMILLCKKHHTSGKFGIHHVPFPDWVLQKFAQDGFDFLVE
jgi:hypothetical protein